MFSGLLQLPWWGYVLVALGLTHVTIASVTIYLHRHQAHRGLDLHPIASHFFRYWLWLTTGMITKEWVAVHRKHHARCETEEDPHSPQILGINRVLWGGVLLYVKECDKPETLERFGQGTPDDWIERNLYTPVHKYGIALMAVADLALFGAVPGALIWGVQMLWIPFWAAGVINGVGHFWGYRKFGTEDASRNIVPWGIIIGGEELHNNHHAYPSSAKLSSRWYELDMGWVYIRMLESIGLADVKRIAPKVRLDTAKINLDQATLDAVITHRYDVMAKFASSLKTTCGEELARLRGRIALPAGLGVSGLDRVKHWLHLDQAQLPEPARNAVMQVLNSSKLLATIFAMRQDLVSLWARSNLSREQLLTQLQDWCRRAEESGIQPLQDFSRKLRWYAA